MAFICATTSRVALSFFSTLSSPACMSRQSYSSFVSLSPVLSRHATTRRRHVMTTARQAATTSPDTSFPPSSAPVSASTADKTFRLAPSDFAFLWNECKRCFYLKVHGKVYRPRVPFPSIFNTIDLGMKRHFRGLRTTDVLTDGSLPAGTFLCEDDDAWVESEPITPPGHSSSIYIRGMIDCLVRFDDGTFGVIDFKTSKPSPRTAATYASQLHAYAAAIERPSEKSELQRCEISRLALVVYEPADFYTPVNKDGNVMAALNGSLSCHNVDRDDAHFQSFMGEILDVLLLPNAPDPPKATGRSNKFSSCPYCQYLHECNHLSLIP